MAGLDKITGQIIEEAKLIAADTLDAARKEAEAIIEEAKTACLVMEKEAADKEKNMRAIHEGRIQSSADQQRRTAMLRAKQELISAVIEEAYQALKSQNLEDYFLTMEKLIKTYALAEAGEIYFSEADLARIPQGFEAKIEAAAGEKGGSLKLMPESRQIPDGFVLVYGGIEENCTLKALLNAKRDQLQDKVNQVLFA